MSGIVDKALEALLTDPATGEPLSPVAVALGTYSILGWVGLILAVIAFFLGLGSGA